MSTFGKIGARGLLTPHYTASDYAQANLVAMWDGIENADWGVHSQSITLWKDLTGNGADFQIGNSFNVLDNGIEILNTVNSTGQGHPVKVTWNNNDNLVGEFVVDLSGVDRSAITSNNGNSLVMLRVGGGATGQGTSNTSCPCIWLSKNGALIAQGYNSTPRTAFPVKACSFSWQCGNSRMRKDGQFITASEGWPGSDHAYACPILGAYAGRVCPHSKILAMRLYSSLSDKDSMHNYFVDRQRFNL